VIDAISSALGGMQRNQEAFGRHADRIARSGLEPAGGETIDLSRELTGAMAARRGYEANLTVIRVADDMVGSLLDILA
jgi:flagellar hook protein FlgE